MMGRAIATALWPLTALSMFLAPLTACQDKGGGTQEKTAASAKEDGKAEQWRCYDFSVKNGGEIRKITDLHFTLPAGVTAGHVVTPTGWQGGHDANGALIFKTPPDPPAGGGTAAPPPAAPIDPGKTLEGFRFCLKKDEKISISMSYDRGDPSAATVWQDVEAGSDKAVRRTSILRCHKIVLRAPSDTEASDVHFSQNAASSKPNFDDVVLPSGWSGGAAGDGVDLDAGKSPIGKGETQSVVICVRGNPDKIDWKLTDAMHNDIPGAKGTVALDH
jgi:hypothetical protein